MYYKNAELGKNKWWRYCLSIIIVVVGQVIGQVPLMLTFYSRKEALGFSDTEFEEIMIASNFAAFELNENITLLLVLLPFLTTFIGLLLAVKYVHKRPLLSLFTGRQKFDWRRMFTAFLIWGVLGVLFIFFILPSDGYVYQFNWEEFLPLLLISIVLIPIQTSLEEVFFRGYIFQGIQLLVKHRFVSILIITLLFAILHAGNPEFEQGFFKIIGVYVLLSGLLGTLTILDNGLELPIGIHAANNLIVALVLSASDGAINTPSIFKTNMTTLIDVLPLLLFFLVVITLILLQIKYKWNLKNLFIKG